MYFLFGTTSSKSARLLLNLLLLFVVVTSTRSDERRRSSVGGGEEREVIVRILRANLSKKIQEQISSSSSSSSSSPPLPQQAERILETAGAEFANDVRLILGEDDESTISQEELDDILEEVKNKIVAEEMEDGSAEALTTTTKKKKTGGGGSCDTDVHVTARALQSTYVDRHIRHMEALINDPDCTTREFDASDPNFDIQEARDVFTKCRFLVLRNAIDRNFMNEYKSSIMELVVGLQTDRINRYGLTSTGDPKYVRAIDDARFEVLLPKEHVHPTFVTNEYVMGILRDERILGKDLALHHLSGLFSLGQSEGMNWHRDNPYPFERSGRSSTDIPPYAVQVFSPLVDMTYELGPTEFCLATGSFFGIDHASSSGANANVIDASLAEKGSTYRTWDLFDNQEDRLCPPVQYRTPILNVGDYILSDSYTIVHRGGQNDSPELRPVLAITYNRNPFLDKQSTDPEEYDLDIYDVHREALFGEHDAPAPDYDDEEMMEKLLLRPRFSLAKVAAAVETCGGGGEDEEKDRLRQRTLEEYRTFRRGDVGMMTSTPAPSAGSVDDDRGSVVDDKKAVVDFMMTNMDVVIGSGGGDGGAGDEGATTLLYVDGEEVGELSPRSSLLVSAVPGSHVELRSSEGSVVLQEWTVIPQQGQLIVTNQSLDCTTSAAQESDAGM